MSGYDSSSSSSSDSSDDDEYLLGSSSANGGKNEENREAMIRRKLLQSFYGTSAPSKDTGIADVDGGEDGGGGGDGDDTFGESFDGTRDKGGGDNDNRVGERDGKHDSTNPSSSTNTDINLDSNNFNSTLYTQTLLQKQDTQTILKSTNDLSQSIRLLDSTMQTLVYENYSKFISATDAIRSIGQSGLEYGDDIDLNLENANDQMKLMNVDAENENGKDETENKGSNETENTRSIKPKDSNGTFAHLPKKKNPLAILYEKMTQIESRTQYLERSTSLSLKRKQVVEKLKLQRLLQRLTRLVELPNTLRKLQSQGRYEVAMRDYCDAMRILEVHSGEFESLRNIMQECNIIVKGMMLNVGLKMWVWCGYGGGNSGGIGSIGNNNVGNRRRRHRMLRSTSTTNNNLPGAGSTALKRMGNAGSINMNTTNKHTILERFWMEGGKLALAGADLEDIVPTKDVREIYECAGALLHYAQHRSRSRNVSKTTSGDEVDYKEDEDDVHNSDAEAHNSDGSDTFLGEFTEEECKAVALESVTVYLESLLEDHLHFIDNMNVSTDTHDTKIETDPTEPLRQNQIYPEYFLNGMLEAATLYGVTFRSHMKGMAESKQQDSELLQEYVTTWFTSFLAHVKHTLAEMEQTRLKISGGGEVQDDVDKEGKEEGDDEAFVLASNQLSDLVRSVREVASGLALPEVGLDMEIASSFVEEAVGTIEAMVRRRVRQKFVLLRVRVLKDCIVPFVKSIQESAPHTDDDENGVEKGESTMVKTIQAAKIALSDGMQFVDDTIRSILSNDDSEQRTGMANVSLDSGMMKLAVRKNAREFAFWLAAALETLAGSEATYGDVTLDVKPIMKNDDENFTQALRIAIDAAAVSKFTDDFDDGYDRVNEEGKFDDMHLSKDQVIIRELSEYIQDNHTDASIDILNIALVEMCRLAERNVANNINQSITSSIEDYKIKHDFFKDPKQGQDSIDTDKLVSTRFRLASSRSLAIYARAKGYEAASTACHEIIETSRIQSEFFPHGPSDAAIKILEVMKYVCVDCAAALGGRVCASLIPDFSGDYRQDMNMIGSLGMSGMVGSGGAMKGLSLDVARMFTQKVQAYSHPLEMIPFSRDDVVSSVLIIVCKAWVEQIRQSTFTTFAYRQMQVDIEFLKYLLPHYVDEDGEAVETLKPLLSDVVLNAGERCVDFECVGITEYYDEAMGKVMTPLSIALNWLKEEEAAGGRGALDQFVVREGE